jgi:hypothetical protein
MTASLEVRPVQDSETPATPVFAAPIRHPSAWTVADFRSPADYTIDLDAAQLRDIAAAMRRIKAAVGATTEPQGRGTEGSNPAPSSCESGTNQCRVASATACRSAEARYRFTHFPCAPSLRRPVNFLRSQRASIGLSEA